MTSDSAQLTPDEKRWAFRRATNSMEGSDRRWADRVKSGLTDEHLAEALRYELGAMGGSCGTGELGVSHQGNGLKIWADRCAGSRLGRPILEGTATLHLAREVYGIRDPADKQISLF